MTIEDIKRRLMSRGFEEDELKALFKTDAELEAFYNETFKKMRKVGNIVSKDEKPEKDNYKLTVGEKREAKRLHDQAKPKKKALKKAVAPKSKIEVKEFKDAGKHLGADAGTPADLSRLLEQLNEEED